MLIFNQSQPSPNVLWVTVSNASLLLVHMMALCPFGALIKNSQFTVYRLQIGKYVVLCGIQEQNLFSLSEIRIKIVVY